MKVIFIDHIILIFIFSEIFSFNKLLWPIVSIFSHQLDLNIFLKKIFIYRTELKLKTLLIYVRKTESARVRFFLKTGSSIFRLPIHTFKI